MNRLLSVYLDANCIGAWHRNKEIEELKQLNNEGKIIIEPSDLLSEEFRKNKGYPRGEKELSKFIISFSNTWDKDDRRRFTEVLQILFGKKEIDCSENQKCDACHINQAIREGIDYFVTNDKEILEKATEIKKRFCLTICKPESALKHVKQILKIN